MGRQVARFDFVREPLIRHGTPPNLPVEEKTSATWAAYDDALQDDALGVAPGQPPGEVLLNRFVNSSVWIYVACMRIAQAAAQIPIMAVDDAGQGTGLTGPLRGLRDLLRYPNDHQSKFDFIESVFLSTELLGNGYIEKAQMTKTGRPSRLYALNAAHMTLTPDPRNLVKAYHYTVNGTVINFQPDEIIHIKYANPFSELFGLSPLIAGTLSLETDRYAQLWNRNLLKRGGMPTGAIRTDNEVTSVQARKIKQEIRSVMQRGAQQAGRLMLLTGGLEYQAISINPHEMDWPDVRRFSRDEILSIYNVPLSVAGVASTEQTTTRSAGMQQQIGNFYRLNVVPKFNGKFLGALNRGLVRSFRQGIELTADVAGIRALQDDLQRDLVRAQIFRILTSSGWNINKALASLYPQEDPVKWGNVAWMNAAMAPIAGPKNPVLDDKKDNPASEKAQRIARRLNVPADAAQSIERLFADTGSTNIDADLDAYFDHAA